MSVSVYTLRVRDAADDEMGHEVRLVAASLAEALARAEEQEIAQKDGAGEAGHDGQATQAAADDEAENRQPEEQE